MTADGASATEKARAELVETLNAIEDKLNVPKQAKATYQRLRAEKPQALIAGAAGVAAAVGLGVWAIVRAVSK